MKTKQQLIKNIRRWIAFFMTALVISGTTAFPLQNELDLLGRFVHLAPADISVFIRSVHEAITYINIHHPFLAYGTDWLAFAHIVIAISFYGPYQNPVKNVWVIESGMISCLLVLPLAFICGAIRGIPFYWQLIDCSFGIAGILPLRHVHRQIKKLEALNINTTNLYEVV